MAGDWIKMRIDLQTHPKIVRILSATKSDKFRVIGGLHAVWGVFDQHSEDGVLHGYTLETMDHVIGWQGFSQALSDVGWLVQKDAQALVMPEFYEHNGQSAKRRAEDQKRKRNGRKTSPQSVQKNSDKKQTREEKRREDKRKIFIKPTREQLAEYFAERGLTDPSLPDRFLNHYESNGWKVGKNPMKDWKAAVRTWEQNQKAQHETDQRTRKPGFQGSALERFEAGLKRDGLA